MNGSYYRTDGCPVGQTAAAIGLAAMESNAARFVENPALFFKNYADPESTDVD